MAKKSYVIEGGCKHFGVFASLCEGFDSRGAAMEAGKKQLLDKHSNYPGAPEHIAKECLRTCRFKMTIKEVNTKSEY